MKQPLLGSLQDGALRALLQLKRCSSSNIWQLAGQRAACIAHLVGVKPSCKQWRLAQCAGEQQQLLEPQQAACGVHAHRCCTAGSREARHVHADMATLSSKDSSMSKQAACRTAWRSWGSAEGLQPPVAVLLVLAYGESISYSSSCCNNTKQLVKSICCQQCPCSLGSAVLCFNS